MLRFITFLSITILFFLISSPKVFAYGEDQTIISGPRKGQKVCPSGKFLDVYNNSCRNLITNFGFKGFNLPSKLLTTCSVSELKSKASAGNIYITIPANCTLKIDGGFTAGNNLVIEGSGISSVIHGKRGDQASLIAIEKKQNIIISNLHLYSDGSGLRAFELRESNNILIHNNYIHDFYFNGVKLNDSKQEHITISYNTIDDILDNHGIKAAFANERLSIHSNYIGKTGWVDKKNGYGLDAVSRFLEIAGNYIDKKGEGSGVKLPSTQDVVYHYNFLENARTLPGVRTYTSASRSRKPNTLYYMHNTIKGGEIVLNDATKVFLNGNSAPVKNGSQITSCKSVSGRSDIKVNKSITLNYGKGDIDICTDYAGGTIPTPNVGTPTPTPKETTPTPTEPIFNPKYDINNDLKNNLQDLLEIIKFVFQ